MIREIFCDESRPRVDRYMLLGGVIVSRDSMTSITERLSEIRDDKGIHAEIKWSKVSKKWLPKYKAVLDYFFERNRRDRIHFAAMIFDGLQVDHRLFSHGDCELGFYKFYYQLLLHCFGRHYCPKPEDRFIAYLDQRKSSYPVRELRPILNNGLAKLGIRQRPFLAVEPRDSKLHDLMQIVDVLIGAIGYQKNGYHLRAGCSPAKVELAEYIAKQIGVNDLGRNTRFGVQRFKIWNFRLKDPALERVKRALGSRLDFQPPSKRVS